jgi:hypothetical protein
MTERQITLHLRDTETGETGTETLPWLQDDESLRLYFTGGNGSCDCNRSNWLNGSDLPCGEDRIALDRVVDEYGRVLYRDADR